MRLILSTLIFPVALVHSVFRKHFCRDNFWTLQKSVDHLWAGNHVLGWAQRKDENESLRAHLPPLLYDADLYIEYGRFAQARENIEAFLQEKPGDGTALALLRKLPPKEAPTNI